MNMSEFEEGHSSESRFDSDDPSDEQNRKLPDDFSADDAAFVEELTSLFSLDHEEVPPLFVQTLMASEDLRFQPVEEAFEKKTSARVFRRLHLKRRLFQAPHFSLRALPPPRSFLPASRPLIASATACVIFMLLTVIMASQAFASGLAYLWSGPHSGVLQVNAYPSVTAPAQDAGEQNDQNKQISISEAQKHLRFPLYWPQDIPERYAQHEMYLYPGDQTWADGSVVVLTFTYTAPGLTPRQIAICEFKPQGRVLQVTQHGAAHRIEIGSDGSSGIYIEGQWTQPTNATVQPSWVYTDRSEMIYENKDTGVVFWIVGDKRDGIDSAVLKQITQSLQLFEYSPDDVHMGERFDRVTQAVNRMPWPFANDVIYLDNPDNPGGPSFRLVHAGSHHTPFPRMFN
jgi:hypothetical protein